MDKNTFHIKARIYFYGNNVVNIDQTFLNDLHDDIIQLNTMIEVINDGKYRMNTGELIRTVQYIDLTKAYMIEIVEDTYPGSLHNVTPSYLIDEKI